MGVCALSRPCGWPLTTDILKTDEIIWSELNSLWTDLTFESEKKLVLLISFASDEMIQETMKYPKVSFVDCTGGVNKQKREFFLFHTPSGKCHLSNMTAIPSGVLILSVLLQFHNILITVKYFISGKSWVYRYIFKDIFFHFYMDHRLCKGTGSHWLIQMLLSTKPLKQ